MNGSILKMNHSRDPLPAVAPSGIIGLEIAREGLAARQPLADPDGNKVSLVPKGANGVEGIAILLRVNDPAAHVQRLAVDKSHAVAQRYKNAAVIIAADTTVDLDGKIFGQPADEQDARTMLNELSGRTHQVHTAVAVVHLAHDGTMLSQAHGLDSAGVSMLEITPEKMEWYLATGESMGKAGSYAVQGDGGALVERVEGSLTTVIGLPLDLLSDLLVQVNCGWKNEA